MNNMRLKTIAAVCLLLATMAEGYVSHTAGCALKTRNSALFGKPEHAHHNPLSALTMVGTVVDYAEDSMQPIPSLSSSEVYVLMKLEMWYNRALSLKCPWMRRRMLDFVDTLESVARVSVIRKQNLGFVGPPMGCRGDASMNQKVRNLAIEDVAALIRADWKETNSKGYYVTGKLNPAIYRNDCFFDGPDPDMPVKGLRKFIGAASQLFDRKLSRAELLDLWTEDGVIKAKWRMNGVIRLPWKPRMPQVIGETTYHLDEDGLIYLHEETWDISAVEAFLKMGMAGASPKDIPGHPIIIDEEPESVPIS